MLGCRKSMGGCEYGKTAMMLMGIGMIVFAWMFFKDVPFMGTVFLLPGEDIMNAQMADPVVRDVLFLVGGVLTAYGIQLRIKIGFTNPLKQSDQNAIPGRQVRRGGARS